MKKYLSLYEKVFPWVVLAFVYVIAVGFIVLRGRAYLDSDMASEMILADILNKEGRMISDNWYSSTGLPIFTQHPFLQFGLLLYPNDWNMARAVGMALMLGLLAGAYLFFVHAMQDRLSRGVLFAAVTVCPFGFWYMNLVTFGGYYLPALIIMILGAAFIFAFCSDEEPITTKRKIIFAFSVVVAFCGGLKDVRCLMNLYVPFAVAAFILLIYKIHKDPDLLFKFKSQEWNLFIAATVSLFSSVAGYLINTLVLAKKYSFQGMIEQTWGELSFKALLDVWSDFFSLFGYQNDDFANSLSPNQTSPQLFSLQGLVSVLGIVVALAILLSSIRLLQRWRELTFRQQALVALYWSIFIINGMIYAWTEGYESNLTYWVPALPFALMLLETEIATENFSIPSMRKISAVGFICCVLCTSYITMREYQTEPLRANSNYINISNWLVENGYTEGYASFWNSNVLTVLSNGQLEMWSVYNLNDRAVQPWLQKKDHVQALPDAERVFVVVGPDDEISETGSAYSDYKQADLVFSDEFGFSILELNNN